MNALRFDALKPATALVRSVSPGVRESIERIFFGRAVVKYCDDTSKFISNSVELSSAAVAIYELSRREDVNSGDRLYEFHRRFPLYPLIVVSRPTEALNQRESVFAWTTDIWVQHPTIGASAFERTLDETLERAVRASPIGQMRSILAAKSSRISAVVQEFVDLSSSGPRSLSSVSAAADVLQTSVRTIERHMRSAGLPTAHVVFWSIMVYRAAFVLQDPRSTLDRAVALLPFCDKSAVSRRFRLYANMTPAAARSAGGLKLLFEHIEARFHQSTSAAPRPKGRA